MDTDKDHPTVRRAFDVDEFQEVTAAVIQAEQPLAAAERLSWWLRHTPFSEHNSAMKMWVAGFMSGFAGACRVHDKHADVQLRWGLDEKWPPGAP